LQGAPTPAEVGTALERIFARPEFTERSAPPLLRFLGDVWAAVREWLLSLVPPVLLERWHPLFTVLVASVFAVGAVWILVRVLETRSAALREAVPRRGRSDAAAATAFTIEDWEATARAAADAGRFRDAATALYMAAVLRLDQRGVLRFHSAKTPGDYRREVRTDPAVRTAFDSFIRQYLPVVFAPATPDAGAFAALRGRAQELGVHA
jgi:hypothetical protein